MALLTDDLLTCLEHLRIYVNNVQLEIERMKKHLEQEAAREKAEKEST